MKIAAKLGIYIVAHTFIVFQCYLLFSCFLSLLLIATILWKVKQRYDLYRRRQVCTKIVKRVRAIAFKRIQGVEDFFKNARREGGSKR